MSSADVEVRRPGRWSRRFSRAPVLLYRARLGWLLGNRFLMVAHRGRRSGVVHRTVLEVYDHDPAVPQWTVVSGHGTSSDWYRNLQAAPAVRIDVGGRRFVPEQRELDETERRSLFAGYQQRHPRVARQLGRRVLGAPFDATDESIDELARMLPAMAFRPRDDDRS